MNLEEFIINVEKFGGGEVITDRTALLSAANKALHELYLSIPITKTIRYNVRGNNPILHYDKVVCKPGQILTLPLKGLAYSMRIVGKGNCSIDDGENYSVEQIDTGKESLILRGFIIDGGTIKFWGSFTMVIYDFSLYDDIYAPDVTSIPDSSPVNSHDIRAKYSDFISFVSQPVDRFGNAIKNCRLRDGTLEIDSKFSGDIVLTYRRLPTPIYGINEEFDYNEEIDVSEEHVYLLIYLTWYHYLIHVNEAKAAIFRERCDKVLESLNSNLRYIDTNYIDVNGWA